MRQTLFEIPALWLLVALLTAGVGSVVFGLVTRRKDTALTGCVIAAGVALAGILFRQKIMAGHVPIFGFGMMLCLAFFAGSWLAQRLARREGLDVDRLMDLSLWIFIGGIIGARLLFLARNREQFNGPLDFFKFWQGGIVFYGGVVTALLVFLVYTRRFKMPAMQVLDVLAPAVALGIGIGRFGCLLNGCCWGQPSELPFPLAIEFPYGSIPHIEQLFDKEHQKRVSLGFHIANGEGAEPEVLSVDAGSWADVAGLRRNDLVRKVNGREVVRLDRGHEMRDAPALLGLLCDPKLVKPGSELTLEVDRKGKAVSVTGTFTPTPPHSLPVHPTQIYLALAGWALLAATMFYFPRRTRYGEVMALLMVGYATTRFAIEYLRADEPPWAAGLTISQNISIVIFAGGLLLWGWLRRGPARTATVGEAPSVIAHAP